MRPRSGAASLSWLVLVTVAVAASVAFIDEPVAIAVRARFHGTTPYRAAEATFFATHATALALLILLLAAGLRSLGRREPAARSGTPLACAWSLVWAMAAALALKEIFGRSWADPSYVVHGINEWRLLRGRSGFDAFPSMTMMGACAIMAVLWIRAPRTRAAALLAVGVVAAALLITNSHWVSDIVAGAYAGSVIGAMTESLMHRSLRWSEAATDR